MAAAAVLAIVMLLYGELVRQSVIDPRAQNAAAKCCSSRVKLRSDPCRSRSRTILAVKTP